MPALAASGPVQAVLVHRPFKSIMDCGSRCSMHACMQVVEVLGDALSLPETPVPLKVARLLLASDILHNSSAPVRNASRYRSLLEAALPDIFESLQVWAPPSLPFQPYHPSTSSHL